MNPLLATLQTDDFGIVLFAVASPEAHRSLLGRRPEVLAIREAYQNGSLKEQDIRGFVGELLKGFQPGLRLAHEEILEALAVALEPIYDPFTDEYINDLAALHISEMPYATRVARICQKHRTKP